MAMHPFEDALDKWASVLNVGSTDGRARHCGSLSFASMPRVGVALGETLTVPDDIPGGSYSETTRGIIITVQPYYLEDQSVPEARHFVWAYHVKIENRGRETVRLVTRHWQITDSMGKVQNVRGEGVVGKQPTLKPGETFEYASGTPLATPSGIMVGTYQMLGEDGEQFDARIPAFSLDSPYSTKAIH